MNPSDHDRLHEWVARSALAGATISVVSLLIGGTHGQVAWAATSAALVLAIGVAVDLPRSLVDAAKLTLLVVAAGSVAQLTVSVQLPLQAAILGLTVGRGAEKHRVVASLVGACAAVGALIVQHALIEAAWLVPHFGVGLSTLFAGALSGAVLGLGTIGRLVARTNAVSFDPAVGLDRLALEVCASNADVGALLTRAAEAHRQAAGSAAGTQAVDDLVRRMTDFGREWLEIERHAAATPVEALVERVAMLEGRLEKTQDPVAVAELRRAISAIDAQKRALREILAGRERSVARLEHQVATLERLRIAALRHRSADAARLQAELQPVLDELAEAGGEHDLASDAIRDADAETTAPALLPTRAH